MRIGNVEKPYMTVGDLRKLLEDFPQDMPVIQTNCSDYDYMEPPTVVKGVDVNQGEYVRMFHWSESEEKLKPNAVRMGRFVSSVAVREYCHFEGN